MDSLILYIRLVSWLFKGCFVEITVSFAHNIYPDQMPLSADMGFHCMYMKTIIYTYASRKDYLSVVWSDFIKKNLYVVGTDKHLTMVLQEETHNVSI